MSTHVPAEDIPAEAEALSYVIEQESEGPPALFRIRELQFHATRRGGKLAYKDKLKRFPDAPTVGWSTISEADRVYGRVL